ILRWFSYGRSSQRVHETSSSPPPNSDTIARRLTPIISTTSLSKEFQPRRGTPSKLIALIPAFVSASSSCREGREDEQVKPQLSHQYLQSN
ncbi:unnamed protein product, partial [Linum tenue]